jgi:hypothetical protein
MAAAVAGFPARRVHALEGPGDQGRCRTVGYIGDSVSYYIEHNLHDPSQPDGLITSAFARHGWSGEHFWLTVGRGRTIDEPGKNNFVRDNPAGPPPVGYRETGYVDPESGLKAVERITMATHDGIDCWVIALGTNDAARLIQRDDANLSRPMSHYRIRHSGFAIDRLMARIGDRLAIWIDTSVREGTTTPPYLPEGAAEWNSALESVVGRYPNMVIIRWTDLIARHPEWYDRTGYHYTPSGNAERAEFMAAALEAVIRPTAPNMAGALHRLLGAPERW